MITEKVFNISDGENAYYVIANNYKEAFDILTTFRPKFKVKSFDSYDVVVLTKENVERELKKK